MTDLERDMLCVCRLVREYLMTHRHVTLGEYYGILTLLHAPIAKAERRFTREQMQSVEKLEAVRRETIRPYPDGHKLNWFKLNG